MSVEEAGEEILLGSTEVCASCEGKGGWRIQDESSVCAVCNGQGKVYREPFKKACYTLDMPIPEMGEGKFQAEGREILRRMHEQAAETQKYMHELSKRIRELRAAAKPMPSFFPHWAKR